MTWQLVIFLPSPSQNVREKQHHMDRHKSKGLWWWCIRSSPGFLCVPPDTGKRRVTVERHTRSTFQDPANVIGGCKGIVDDLVDLKLLKGDTEQWIEHGQPVQVKLAPREKEYTVLILKDVA
jgi:hypothetical protein